MVGRFIFGVTSNCSTRGSAVVAAPPNSSAIYFAEPFRIFFPVGLFLGAIGVALWPLFVWHAIEFYPAQAHVRLMIEGLMGSFIIGFLGTAGPRLLAASPLIVAETCALLGLQIVSAFLHLAQRQTAGDIVFLMLLLLFVGMMAKRAASAKRSAAAAVRSGHLWIVKRYRRNFSDNGGEIARERTLRESTRQSDA